MAAATEKLQTRAGFSGDFVPRSDSLDHNGRDCLAFGALSCHGFLSGYVLFEEFRFRSALAQTQIELLEDKVQEFRSFVKEAEERLEKIHEETKILMAKSWCDCAVGVRERQEAAQ